MNGKEERISKERCVELAPIQNVSDTDVVRASPQFQHVRANEFATTLRVEPWFHPSKAGGDRS